MISFEPLDTAMPEAHASMDILVMLVKKLILARFLLLANKIILISLF